MSKIMGDGLAEVSGERIDEMDEEMLQWQLGTLDHLRAGNDGRPPEPPTFSPEELDAWSKSFRAKIEASMVAACGGQEAYDRLNGQIDAMAQARTEADRSIAIVQTSVVEEHLRAAIERYFPGKESDPKAIERIFNPMDYGPLGNVTARVDIAFALGIIGTGARSALKIIASIRNLFAHRLEIHSFDHPEVNKLVGRLTYIDFAITGPDAEGLIHLWHRKAGSELKFGPGFRAADSPFDSRGKFEKTCEFLQAALRECGPDVTHPDLHEK